MSRPWNNSHYTVVVNPTAGVASGNVALSLVAGGAIDTAGNAAAAANLSGLDSQGIDTLAPTATTVTGQRRRRRDDGGGSATAAGGSGDGDGWLATAASVTLPTARLRA